MLPPGGGTYFLALGVLDYRVLGTNFRDYAIVFTQLEFKDEAFNTVELYSTWWGPRASPTNSLRGSRAGHPPADCAEPRAPRVPERHACPSVPCRRGGWGTGHTW